MSVTSQAPPLEAVPAVFSIDRIVAGLVGGALMGAAPRDQARGRVFRSVGIALIGVAIVETVRAEGMRQDQIVARSSIEIERSIEDVFAFVKDFENFPLVIGTIHSIVDDQDGRSHWQVFSPFGDLVEFDVVVTKYVPRSLIAWETIPGSRIYMRGMVRLTSLTPTRTLYEFELERSPQKVGIKNALRALFGPSQQESLNFDLVHLRDYVERLAPHSLHAEPDSGK